MPDLAGVITAEEKRMLGQYRTGHPLRDITHRAQHGDLHALCAADLSVTVTDQEVVMVGVVKIVRSHVTKKGQAMAFVTMEDATGQYSAIVFPMALLMYAGLVVLGACLILRGKVSHRPENRRPAAAKDEGEDGEEEEQATSSIRMELLVDQIEPWQEKV